LKQDPRLGPLLRALQVDPDPLPEVSPDCSRDRGSEGVAKQRPAPRNELIDLIV
jgi:hypothetical protein